MKPVTLIHITGSPITFADGLPVTKIGDYCRIEGCMHKLAYNINGSAITMADGLPVHRVGDQIIWPGGTGISQTGSITTFTV